MYIPSLVTSLCASHLMSRIVLDQIPYSSIVSVHNEEPPTEHSLIIHLHSYVMLAIQITVV